MSVIICGGRVGTRRYTGCPVCKIADAPIVASISSSPYYGDIHTCTLCGDKWSDGELWGRPFRRGWRQEAIAQAIADWEAGCECPVDRDEDMYALPCKHTKRGES